MGCGGSKPDDEPGSPSGSRTSAKGASSPARKGNKVVEELFRANGVERNLGADEVLIEQGSTMQNAFYIKSGRVKLLQKGEDGNVTNLATRGVGDVLGELSLLLGHPATVTAVTDGAAVVIEVTQEQLMTQLREEPAMSGRLFKAMAVALAERISELSSKLRANVVSSSGMPQQKAQALPAADLAKARGMFGLANDEKLISFYQCSVRAEKNAIKDEHAHVGEVYVFGKFICFDLKVFAFHKQLVIESKDIQALLRADGAGAGKVVELQLKGASYELTIEQGFDEACMLMEASRMQAKAASIAENKNGEDEDRTSSGGMAAGMEQFNEMLEPIVLDQSNAAHNKHKAVDFDLKEEDWKAFLQCARQRTYQKGEYILKEGQPTAALFQIVRGTVRVELQIKDKAKAVVVGYRQAGEMFGETSLLKSGVATASIAADSEAVIVCLEGAYLEELFQSSPGLPGRFFCFIAAYEAERLYQLTRSAAEGKATTVTASSGMRVAFSEVTANTAFSGVLRKWLASEASTTKGNGGGDDTKNPDVALASFDLIAAEKDFAVLPNAAALMRTATTLVEKHLSSPKSASYLPYFPTAMKEAVEGQIKLLEEGTLQNADARKMFGEMARHASTFLESHWFEGFLGSDHYGYILDLKAKEGIVPKLDQFQVIRVLGEGGFGQVIEVVKRDCGVRYAMKVMQKEAMKQALGVTWRKKIAMEANILSALQHPFMVNLKYAFQNPDFLCLIMDLVPSGDLSEFVLTPRRLTAAQTKWVIMETVEVLAYMHDEKILYRDLKPENLLVDDEGHVRLIDMGLAVRWTGEKPRRTSRVGTDCYMAPEVRWARKNREAYGMSVDWYTVGVLLYEFTNGALPFSQRDTLKPVYRPGDFPSPECRDLCESLLSQDYKTRIGCGSKGNGEIKEHKYFESVDWDIVAACKTASPLKGVKGVPKRKKDKEQQAQRTAHNMLESDMKESAQEEVVHTWDYVSPVAITEEYLESMYRCVSSI